MMIRREIIFPFLLLLTVSVLTSFSVRAQKQRTLDLVFILHENQAIVPYADIANKLNYYPIINVLLKHPSYNVSLEISGTLPTALQWYNRSTVDFIAQGVSSRQFDLLVSNYAQNIPYSMNDDWDIESR